MCGPTLTFLLKIQHHAPLLSAALCVIGGITAVFIHPLCLLAGGAGILIPLYFRLWRNALLCLTLGCFAIGGSFSHRYDYRSIEESFQNSQGRPIEITGSVTRRLAKTVWLNTSPGDVSFEVVPPPDIFPDLGERWTISGTFSETKPPAFPGTFDRQRWLWRNNVIGRINAFTAEYTGRGNLWSRVLAQSETLRTHISSILEEGSSPGDPRSQVMISLLLGEKRGLDPETLDHFKASGSLHVFAVSGLHIGIAAALLWWLLRLLRIRPLTAKAISIPLLAAYVFATGMPVSAMRAFVMITFFFAITLSRHRINPVNILALTAIVFLLWNPLQLFDAGFQLSFLIFGVIITIGIWGKGRSPVWSPDPLIPQPIYTRTERFLVRHEQSLRLLVLLSICCWIAAIPLTILNFGTFNLYSALTNCVMSPFIPVMMATCFLSVAFSWFTPLLIAFNSIGRLFASILLAIAQATASLPGALSPSSPAAPASQFMILGQTYGNGVVILGNPGLLIDPGKPENVRFTVTPSLMSEGFTPQSLLLTRPQKTQSESFSILKNNWPNIVNISHSSPLKLSRPDGEVSIIPQTGTIRSGINDDRCPIVRWEHQGRALLFVGNASLNSVMNLPPNAQKADVLIIGRHAKDPVDQTEWIVNTGASLVIFTQPVPETLVNKLKQSAIVEYVTGDKWFSSNLVTKNRKE